MIHPESFFNLLQDNGIEFFTGVPDSLLKNICAYISDNVSSENHIIAANEGGAIALGAGYHLSTGKVPVIYMQNSGLGNATNPLLSLADKNVYRIPMLLLIGWRGEPGVKDEPQHITQGEVTIKLLETMQIPYRILSNTTENINEIVEESISSIKENSCPYAFVVKKHTFEPYELQKSSITHFEMKREDAIKKIVNLIDDDDIIISTTGKTSRELFEYREELGHDHNKDFLTVGSMGHTSQIALGIALQLLEKQVYCFDGDGSIIMHTGSLGIIGDLAPKNFKHIVFNNGAHDSVGGQPTIGFESDLIMIAKGFNYKYASKVDTAAGLKMAFIEFKSCEGPALLEVCINKGARKDLGRPTSTPIENKQALMEFLRK